MATVAKQKEPFLYLLSHVRNQGKYQPSHQPCFIHFLLLFTAHCRLMNNICSLFGRQNLLKQEAHEVGDEKSAKDIKRLEPCSSPRKRSRPDAFRNSPLGI